jgi:hypothetical protein
MAQDFIALRCGQGMFRARPQPSQQQFEFQTACVFEPRSLDYR